MLHQVKRNLLRREDVGRDGRIARQYSHTLDPFIALGAGLILVTILLYVGWVLLDWRNGILLFLGVLLLALIIAVCVVAIQQLGQSSRREYRSVSRTLKNAGHGS